MSAEVVFVGGTGEVKLEVGSKIAGWRKAFVLQRILGVSRSSGRIGMMDVVVQAGQRKKQGSRGSGLASVALGNAIRKCLHAGKKEGGEGEKDRLLEGQKAAIVQREYWAMGECSGYLNLRNKSVDPR